MSEPVTALGGATFEGAVTITERPAQGMITIRADLSSAKIVKALTDVAGVAMPAMRGAVTSADTGLLWMSPDEAMLLCPYAESTETVAALNTALTGEHALIVDVSDARAVFRLEGSACREVLAKVTPADLREQSLPVGELRRTRMAQVAAALRFLDNTTVELICFRSVASYMFKLLSTAAAPSAQVDYRF
ncbi:MAG: sarcosine oxidase subunit gamma [Marinovum sp.]|nr:sarcosine oxidase subunit gamma [Marinovum sp.]